MPVRNLDEGIKFYFDSECKRPIEKVQWDSGFHVTMADGKTEHIQNVVKEGEMAVATFYVRNETEFRFGVRDFSFPDRRVKIHIVESWLYPSVPVKVVLSVLMLPTTKKEIVESAQFSINGFFVIDR